MHSTMPDYPLTIGHIFRHGQECYPDSLLLTNHGDRLARISFADLAGRAGQLAGALRDLGIQPGDRVATFAWNNQEHQEAYFAVPCMGAVMHTVNIRLSAEQIRYVVGHAEDRVLIVDASLAPVLAPVLADLPTVEHVIVFGAGDRSLLPGALDYEDLLAAQRPQYEWPAVEESAAAAMCYTSGTTDLPKGVVYSHRSTFLHSLGVCSGEALGLSQADRVLPVVPMFHGNAWGLPYAAWLVGADLLLPGRLIQAAPLAALIRSERATLAAAVPTVWYDMLALNPAEVDLTSLRMIMCGGAAVPRSLIEQYEQRFGARLVQGWGLTETSPVASLAFPPKGCPPEQEIDYESTAGRPLGGVEARIVADDGTVLPNDGESVGEIEVRGPWVTAAYYRDPAPAKFHDGWLRTGDVGRMDAHGFITISDRAKDVIKSGGEWISSLELEAAITSHPAVREAAVIATPDERWGERPLALICPAPGESVSPQQLRVYLSERVVRWWLPEKWAFIEQVPRTSVGKYDKKLLRAKYAEGAIDVVVSGGAAERPANQAKDSAKSGS
jgi:fatty-acyl-CoA synthase